MKLIISGFILCVCLNLYGEIIAGIALRVNGYAITLNEISTLQTKFKISRQKAIDLLINERLKDDEIERFKINIEDFKIDEEINIMAGNANLTKEQLFKKLAQQGISMQEYRAEIKKGLQNKELMQRIIASNISISSEDELLNYYTKNKKEFLIPSNMQVVRYLSQNNELLQKAILAPNQSIANVQKINETISLSSLNPQIAQIFINTPNNEFTPILSTGGKGFVSFFIKNRLGKKLLSFEEAKPIIHQKIIAQKEQSIINEHFNRIRSSANIIILRE